MRETILIVEDDSDLRSALSTLAVDAGYDVATAWNGRAALDRLRNHPLPAVILLDLEMPVMDGVEFCQQKNRDVVLADLPVVIISGRTLDSIDEQQLGSVVLWLPKPTNAAAVLRAIRQAVQGNVGSRNVA